MHLIVLFKRPWDGIVSRSVSALPVAVSTCSDIMSAAQQEFQTHQTASSPVNQMNNDTIHQLSSPAPMITLKMTQ